MTRPNPLFLWLYRSTRLAVAVIPIFLATFAAAQEGQPETATIPATRAGNQLMWVMKVLNGQELGELSDHFSDRYVQLKTEEIKELLPNMREKVFEGKKIVINKILDDERELDISAEITAEDTWRYLHVFLILDEASGKIAGLRFSPAGGMGRNINNWQQFEQGAAKLGGEVSFGAYEVVHTVADEPTSPLTLRVVTEVDADTRLAIGSTFKLYVLGALGEMVHKGQAKWSDKLAIQDALKSLPEGEMQDLKAGSEHPLSEYALKMISLSDNTAADHLIHKVGRAEVEASMARLNLKAARSFPFLTTREYFKLKVGKDKDLLARYAAADTAARRALLETEVAKATLDDDAGEDWEEPIEINRVGWFASASECCRVMMDLHRLEKLPGMEHLGIALRDNAGLRLDREAWPEVGYKGGSEPGVLNMTWLLERDDGRVYVMSIGWNNHEKVLQENRLIDMATAAFRLLAQDGREKAKDAPAPARPRPNPGEEPDLQQ